MTQHADEVLAKVLRDAVKKQRAKLETQQKRCNETKAVIHQLEAQLKGLDRQI